MVLAAAFVWLVTSGDLTLTNPGTTLGRLCAELSKASGQRLEAGPDVSDMAVVIRVKDLPIQAVLDKIADATGATWTKRGDNSFRLSRTKEDRNRILEAHLAFRKKAFLDGVRECVRLSKLDKRLSVSEYAELIREQQAIFEQQRTERFARVERSMEIAALSPNQRLIARLISGVDADAVAKLEPGRYLVFATNPTAAELPIGGDVADALQRYGSEQQEYANARAGAGFVVDPKTQERIAKVAITVTRYFALGNPSIQVFAWNPSGDLCFTDFGGNLNAAAAPPANEIDPNLRFELSPQALAFARAFQNDPHAPPLTAPQTKMLWDPAKFEPASLFYGPALIACAEKLDRNLIAIPQDDDVRFGGYGALSARVIQVIRPSWVGSEWITAVPDDLFEYPVCHIDRELLADYLASTQRLGSLTCAHQVLGKHPWPLESTLLPEYEATIGIGANRYWFPRETRFYCSLTPAQTSRLESGGTLKSSDLSNLQRELLADWIMNRPQTYLVPLTDLRSRPDFPKDYPGPTVIRGNSSIPEKLSQMPSELFAEGLSSCEIRANVRREVCVKSATPNRNGIYTPNLIADLLRQGAEPPTQFQVGASRHISLTVSFGGKFEVTSSLDDNFVRPDGKTLKYDELPLDFRAEVERARNGSPPTTNGGGKPPP